MSFKSPPEIAQAGVETGTKKAALSWDKAVVAGFLAGAYIAFAGLLAIVASAGMDPERWGGVQTLVTGGVFALGLILVVIAGSELLTGNMALVPLAALSDRVGLGKLLHNLTWVLVGNLIGSLFVAYFLAVETGVVMAEQPLERLDKIATAKALDETDWQVFLRAVGCNWLVCLAVWMALAAEDIAGKVLAIFFPIMAFVALGFDHVVANMFFLPAAMFADVPQIGWNDVLGNWGLAFLGNFVGALIFVATSYWYLYVRPTEQATAGGVASDPRSDGRFGREEEAAAGSSSRPSA
ncbi:MAG TPA: formate/nitrite transporter family protein [Baekduia sp.]|nr:formate/nitrite transporter family protein [Baekduia sp.]